MTSFYSDMEDLSTGFEHCVGVGVGGYILASSRGGKSFACWISLV